MYTSTYKMKNYALNSNLFHLATAFSRIGVHVAFAGTAIGRNFPQTVLKSSSSNPLKPIFMVTFMLSSFFGKQIL